MRTPLLAKELEAVLASGSAPRRVDILNRITDLFLFGADRYSPDQVRLFDDVIERLLPAVDAKARARLAERLAPLADAPDAVNSGCRGGRSLSEDPGQVNVGGMNIISDDVGNNLHPISAAGAAC